MAGRWTQVVGGVLAWLVLVPLIELVRAAAHRVGLAGMKNAPTPLERPVGSRAPVTQAHGRRAA
jgi:hypothetical protein